MSNKLITRFRNIQMSSKVVPIYIFINISSETGLNYASVIEEDSKMNFMISNNREMIERSKINKVNLNS